MNSGELEKQVIGEVFLDSSGQNLDKVDLHYIANPENIDLFRFLKKYPDTLDNMTLLIHKLEAEGKHKLVAPLTKCLQLATGSSLFETDFKYLKEMYLKKRILDITTRSNGNLTDEDLKQIHKLSEPIKEVKSRISSLETLSLDFPGLHDKRKELFKNGVIYPTGFPTLDEKTGGLLPKNIWVIGGRTSLGKTALMTNIACNLIEKKNIPVIYFSCEMEEVELFDRIISSKTGIESFKIRYGKLNELEMKNVRSFLDANEFYRKKLDICYTPLLDISEIKVIVEDRKPKVIFIDQIQLLKMKGDTRAQAIEDAMYGLKEISSIYDIAIVTASQISRESVKNKSSNTLDPIYFKGSGGIEECATVTTEIKLGKGEDKNNSEWRIDLDISKNRFGSVGSIPMIFDRKILKFKEDL